jgi:hypothetical protein
MVARMAFWNLFNLDGAVESGYLQISHAASLPLDCSRRRLTNQHYGQLINKEPLSELRLREQNCQQDRTKCANPLTHGKSISRMTVMSSICTYNMQGTLSFTVLKHILTYFAFDLKRRLWPCNLWRFTAIFIQKTGIHVHIYLITCHFVISSSQSITT